ncbi:MAG: dihydrofolate reductase [Candidimonas sp.]|nr:MAG: dihydrofolate reductase [Candidimonas sp.]
MPPRPSRPHITIIVAYAENRVIGRGNAMPWHLAGDLAHFKRTTMGQPIIMGRNTWDSLGRPLPGRRNLVVSRNAQRRVDGAELYPSVAAAIASCRETHTVFIIGGAQVYADTVPMADEIIATEIHATIPGDAFFPPLAPSQWEEVERQPQAPEHGLTFDIVLYRRRA